MDLERLNCFVTVYECLNYTKAAEKLHLSQTAVTRAIQQLEQELGTELFDRTHKQISVTESGKVFYMEALRILHQVQISEENMNLFLNGDLGTLKVGFIRNMDPAVLTGIVNEFARKNPNIHLDLSSHDQNTLYKMLKEGQFDCIMTFAQPCNLDCSSVLIRRYELMAAVAVKDPRASSRILTREQLGSVLYDAESNDQEPAELEGILLKIACGQGTGVLPSYLKDSIYREYIQFVPLQEHQEKALYLIYDNANRYERVLGKYVNFIQSNQIFRKW